MTTTSGLTYSFFGIQSKNEKCFHFIHRHDTDHRPWRGRFFFWSGSQDDGINFNDEKLYLKLYKLCT